MGGGRVVTRVGGGRVARRNSPSEKRERGDDPAAAAGTDALRAIWREHARSAAHTH